LWYERGLIPISYDGVTVLELVLGKDGLYGLKNKNLIPIGGLIALRNATLEDHSVRVGGGAALLGSAFGAGAVAGTEAIDYWSDVNTQRTVVVGDDGAVYKDDGTSGSWASLVTGLTTFANGAVPHLVPGGAEVAGNNRKLFLFDRVNVVQVLDGDGAAMAALANPAADWSGANQPGFGAIHQGYLWAGGNANAPHTVYRSQQQNHENFTTSAYSLRVYPGEGERLTAGLTYKGVLLLWKYPDGVYAVDTSDASDSNWRVIKVGSAGAAGPRCVIPIEDDVIWVAPDGTWHLISATTATGAVRTEDIAARKLGSFHRDQINTSRLQYAQMVYYSHKQEVELACSASGQTAKNRRLHLDLNRRTEIGDRWIWWDRDRNECLFMRKTSGIQIPAMVDHVGQVWTLDQATRSANGAAYTFEWFTRDADFGEIVPGWQGRYKNLRFLQVEYDAKSAATHSIEIYLDGNLKQTVASTLSAAGAVLPFTLPATLGTGGLQLTARRRLMGRGRRIAFRGTSGVAGQDLSIMRLLVGMEVGE